jgi:molybdopterin biosynthesis enzyme
MLRGVAEADALILLPEGERTFAVGEVVRAIPLPGWPA